jgi:hypothetical protein
MTSGLTANLEDESDTLHAAVLVQNTIFDVATKCFGKKPPTLNATFPSNEWYDRQKAADEIFKTCEVGCRQGRQNGSQEGIPHNGQEQETTT